jgi:hypothetical protein
MTPRQRETFPPVTLGQIRGHGCRNLLVYCESLWCNHGAVMNADALPDEMPVRSLCPRMVCTACGLIGADCGRTGRRIRTGGRRDRPFAHDVTYPFRVQTERHLLVLSFFASDPKPIDRIEIP